MAITKCKGCKQEVSDFAKTCPHCGITNPGITTVQGIAGLVMLAAIVWVVVKCSSGPDTPDAPAVDVAAEEAKCKLNLQCWGDKHTGTAGIFCKSEVEKLASYSSRWTDGTFEPKFSRFRWLDKAHGTLTFIGDKIEFQNGFGAYQNHIYECDLEM